MKHPAFTKTLYDVRWHVVGYGVGLGIWAAVVVALFPSISRSFEGAEFPEDYLKFFGIEAANFGIASNYFQAEFFSMLPLVLVVYAIVVGTGVLAADEYNRTLELIVAQPISRGRLLVERAAAIVLGGGLILVLSSVGWTVALLFIDADETVSIQKLAGACLAQGPFLLFWLGLSLLLATTASSRGSAAGAATAIAVVMFLAHSIAGIAPTVSWLRYISAFWYSDASTILTDGLVAWHALVLLVSAGLCASASLVMFQRRDLNTGASSSTRLLGVHLPRPFARSSSRRLDQGGHHIAGSGRI